MTVVNQKKRSPGKKETDSWVPLSRDVLSHCEDVSAIFASLAHPTRLKVLCLLMSGEQRVSELTQFCRISQPAMSQFLLRMKRDGLVTNRREGVEVFYRIVDPRLIQLLGAARDIYVGN